MGYDNASGVSRVDPLEILAALIQEAVPELANTPTVQRTRVGRQAASTPQVWPSLLVWVPDGAAWTLTWTQDDVIDRHPLDHPTKPGRPTDYRVPGTFPSAGSLGRIVIRRGYYTGIVQLRVGATTPLARARLEQAIIDFFVAEGGDVRARVPNCGNAWHEWGLGSATWRDAFAFDNVLESELELEAVHPLLVELRNVRIIGQLQPQFTEDLTTDFPSIPTGEIEAFEVQPDGTIIRVVPA
jgi:hypothetical protein